MIALYTIGANKAGISRTNTWAVASIYPAKGNSQAAFRSLYLPAIYNGIDCSYNTEVTQVT
jgi:hypothetical protein